MVLLQVGSNASAGSQVGTHFAVAHSCYTTNSCSVADKCSELPLCVTVKHQCSASCSQLFPSSKMSSKPLGWYLPWHHSLCCSMQNNVRACAAGQELLRSLENVQYALQIALFWKVRMLQQKNCSLVVVSGGVSCMLEHSKMGLHSAFH